jgi:hypothetical protein
MCALLDKLLITMRVSIVCHTTPIIFILALYLRVTSTSIYDPYSLQQYKSRYLPLSSLDPIPFGILRRGNDTIVNLRARIRL